MPSYRRSYRAKGYIPPPPKHYRVIRSGVEIHQTRFYTDAWKHIRTLVDIGAIEHDSVMGALKSGEYEIIPKDPVSPLPVRSR